MITFDAIRSAHLAAITHLCKILPPPQLIGLWLLQGNLNDLSRYGRSLTPMNGPSYAPGGYGQAANMTMAGTSVPLPGNFSVDFVGLPITSFFIGSYEFRFSKNYGNWWLYVYNGGSAVTNKNLTEGGGTDNLYSHCAFYRIGNKVYFAYNGTVKTSITFTDEITSISVTSPAIQNLRITNHSVGTATSFPVPTGFYTGFEPI